MNSLTRSAIAHFHNGDLANAETLLQSVLQDEPGNFDALLVMGVVDVMQGKREQAAESFGKAVAVNPDSGVARFNLATVLSDSGNDRDALPHHDKAVQLAPGNQDAWLNYGKSLANLERCSEALACYENALRIRPDFVQALINRGALLARLNRNEEAVSCFDRALAIDPSHPGAWSNNGDALSCLKRYDEALAHYERAISLRPGDAAAWYKKGNILNQLKRRAEALAHYDQALLLDPDHPFLYGNLLSTRMAICDWNEAESELAALQNKISLGKNAAAPFDVLCVEDSPSLQKKAAAVYARNFSFDPSLGEIPRRPARDKIRIGYFSRDFQNHASAILMAEVIELHDRSRFEAIAFSFGPDANDAMRSRLLSAFDDFIDVRDKTDREIAQLARERGIDIAVDVQGYQTEHRTGIFACRAAPVQVSYLAYPGTLGAAYIDYLVADKTLVPPDSRQHYSEKIVCLPDTYQPNDRQRKIADRQFSREELGLPKDGFVYCCFNGHHKVTPKTFDGWMNILRETSGSVLWLLASCPIAAENLRNEAVKRGVSADRLVFAGHMSLPEHLARHRAADLFLDTLPYNAHTTASDALWAGLPVLTCPGESFASRVAASLLNAIRLPELIAHSQEDYVQRAVDLAGNPASLLEIRRKLAAHRDTAPLFDTPLYTRHLESAYAAMHARHQAGLPPDHIDVA
jgi:predicted O-linked N-acetylglucosamine transferase (SPINDLY family)